MSLALDYLERRVFYILCAFACVFLLLRLISLDPDVEDIVNLDNPEFRLAIEKVQPLLEIILVGTLLISGIPKLFDFIKNNSVKTLVQYCCMFAGMALIVMLVPEYSEASWGEQRLMGVAVVGAVVVVFFFISYWWGKKHTKKEDESHEE